MRIGQKVRIIDGYPRYNGQIGIIEDIGGVTLQVRMNDDNVIIPYSSTAACPECELVEEPKQLPIFN